MRISSLVFLNYFLFLIITIVMISLQCSLWMQFFGYAPAPQIWIPTLVHWTLYRYLKEGLIMTYLLTFIAISLSAIPLSIFLFSLIFCYFFGWLIKQRIYWNGPTYFMMITGLITIFFPLIHLILSWLFEKNPITDLHILDWLLSSLITMLTAFPLYILFTKIDRWTKKERPTEAGSIIYG